MKWAAERWRLYLLAAPTTFRTAVRMDKEDFTWEKEADVLVDLDLDVDSGN